MPSAQLSGRVVVVTGGSRGIGATLARALLDAGASVTITASRDVTQLEHEAQQPSATEHLLALHADVRSEADCARVVEQTIARFGHVDALINNAGRGMVEISDSFHQTPTRFWETSEDAFRALIDVNVLGVFLMTKAAAPHLIARGDGVVLNVSTSAATMMRRGYSPYGPSKAALEAMTAIWAEELLEHGVRVHAVLPGGATDTAFVPGTGPGRRGADGQLLPPSIMVAPVLYLLSDAARGLTGRRIVGRGFSPEQAHMAPRIADGIGVRGKSPTA